MQVESQELKRQQEILKALGHYKGKCDGTWGPRSIEAMRAFEATKQFKPGIPTGGLPFKNVRPWPAGITKGQDGLLFHPLLVAASAPVAAPTAPVVNEVEPEVEVEPVPKKK